MSYSLRGDNSPLGVFNCIDVLHSSILKIGDGKMNRRGFYQLEHQLKTAEIIEVVSVGMGSRVCIDFVDQLAPTEGLFIGNTGHGYMLVLAENRTTDTYPARTFRVNGGAIHQYIMIDNNKTSYLSEIRAGQRIPIFKEDGSFREVAVGRVKIEERPLLRVVAKIDEQEISVTIQEGDSTHLLGPQQEEIEGLSLKKGDKILALPDTPGRHLGEKIQEHIIER